MQPLFPPSLSSGLQLPAIPFPPSLSSSLSPQPPAMRPYQLRLPLQLLLFTLSHSPSLRSRPPALLSTRRRSSNPSFQVPTLLLSQLHCPRQLLPPPPPPLRPPLQSLIKALHRLPSLNQPFSPQMTNLGSSNLQLPPPQSPLLSRKLSLHQLFQSSHLAKCQ